jgi:hypothetical protein
LCPDRPTKPTRVFHPTGKGDLPSNEAR